MNRNYCCVYKQAVSKCNIILLYARDSCSSVRALKSQSQRVRVPYASRTYYNDNVIYNKNNDCCVIHENESADEIVAY